MKLYDVKLWLANKLTDPRVGWMLGAAFRDQIPFRGLSIDTSSPQVSARVKAMLFWRLYETGEVMFIHRFLDSSLDVIELGGSIGAISRHVLSRIGPRRLLTVEANPDLIEAIKNNVGQRASIAHAALAYDKATVAFGVSASSLGGALTTMGTPNERIVEVAAKTLRQLREEAGFEEYALVCDIEGAEHELFERETDELRSCKRIIIELHDTPSRTIHGLAEEIQRGHGFRLLGQRGPVYAFSR